MEITEKTSITQLIDDDIVVLCGREDLLKANVDVEREIVHIGLAAHADMEEEMLESGSRRGDLVGLNFFVDDLEEGEPLNEDILEFSSMINFDINERIGDQRAGNILRDREVIDKTMEILNKWLVQ